MSTMRRLLKAPLNAALACPPLRRRVIFELQSRYYDELRNRIPIGHGLTCPLVFPEAWSSFTEIFVNGEYGRAFEALPLPDRWLDLGCHAGFFSLYLTWRRADARRGGRPAALLVDADSRMGSAVGELLRLNDLESDLLFVHGAVACGDGHRDFRERSHMASSLAELGSADGTVRSVPVLTAADLMAKFPPPYDLVKVDIEGAEHEFVASYDRLLESTEAVLLEWHADQHQPDAIANVRCEMRRRAFAGVRDVTPARSNGPCASGLLLFTRQPS